MTQPPEQQPPGQPPTQRAPHHPPPPGPPPGYGPNPYGGFGSPYQPPSSGISGRTIAIIVSIVVLFVLLFCGGIVGLVIWAADEVQDTVSEFDGSRHGGPDNPITVTEGEAFEIDGIAYDQGWAVQPAPDGSGDDMIVGLEGENDRDDESARTVSLRFTFVDGNDEVGEITCHSNGSISHGNTEELECLGHEGIPDGYEAIEVSATF